MVNFYKTARMKNKWFLETCQARDVVIVLVIKVG